MRSNTRLQSVLLLHSLQSVRQNSMEDLLFAGTLALIYTIIILLCPYILLLALANVAYRLIAGRHFCWLSWRTITPFGILLACGWLFFFYALLTAPVFLITH